MILCLNGQFIPEAQATVSIFDRGFLYGDGLFETLRVLNGRPFRWDQHLDRLEHGARYLRIALPFSRASLRNLVEELIRQNQMPDCLLRLTLSRGIGQRGYSPKGADHPTFALSLHPAPTPPRGGDVSSPHPVCWRLITASVRLPVSDPLAQFKTANKLPQVLARAEADAAGADDALLLNTLDQAVESTTGNLFWIENGTIHTPPLPSGILPGITRAVILELCQALALSACLSATAPTQPEDSRPFASIRGFQESTVSAAQLRRAQGIFLSLSSLGVVEVVELDGHPIPQSPLTSQFHAAYQTLLERESYAPG